MKPTAIAGRETIVPNCSPLKDIIQTLLQHHSYLLDFSTAIHEENRIKQETGMNGCQQEIFKYMLRGNQGFGVCTDQGSVGRKMTILILKKRLIHPRHVCSYNATSGNITAARAEFCILYGVLQGQ